MSIKETPAGSAGTGSSDPGALPDSGNAPDLDCRGGLDGNSAVTAFNLDEFLPYQISVLSRRMSQDLERRYSSRFGLRVPEWRILAHLSQSEPVSVRELKVRVDMHKSRVSRAARRLEEAGLISSGANCADRRLIDLRLTEKGRRMMAEMAPLVNGFQQQLLDRLGRRRDSFRQGLALLLGD